MMHRIFQLRLINLETNIGMNLSIPVCNTDSTKILTHQALHAPLTTFYLGPRSLLVSKNFRFPQATHIEPISSIRIDCEEMNIIDFPLVTLRF